ncbi:hypothetical protein Maes01_02670 [Microbulbifer aestuariivivens]|uniref:Uncharacterized protein n=1 Tax=Microbulbifer aestuariivivens TaxID=1908308 RepID=A0ABP9WVM9_9GAMM
MGTQGSFKPSAHNTAHTGAKMPGDSYTSIDTNIDYTSIDTNINGDIAIDTGKPTVERH